MTIIRAKREGRINVWPDHSTALLAGEETPLAEVLHKMTVYHRSSQAIAYQELEAAGGGGGYTGPLDIVPGAVVAYSQRRLAAAFSGNVIQIDNGTMTQDFAADTSNAVDQAAITTFIGAGDSNSSKWYDQSGNTTDLTPDTSPFTWAASVFGSAPAFISSVSELNRGMGNASVVFPPGAYTVLTVVDYDANAGPNTFALLDIAMSACFFMGSFYNVSGDLFVTVGRNVITDASTYVSTGTISSGKHIIEIVVPDDGVISIIVDGIDLNATLQAGTPQAIPAENIGFFLEGGAGNAAKYGEHIMWNAELSSGNRALIRQNIADYYGIVLP